MKARSLSVLVLAAATALVTVRLAAAQYVPRTPAELVGDSDRIVVATVDSARSRWSGKLIVTDYGLRVEERLAGDAPDRITLTQLGGTIGGETHRVSLAVPLEVGERYLLFLTDPAGRGPAATEITGGWQGAVRDSAGFAELVDDVRAFLAGEPEELAALAASAATPAKPPAKAAFEVRDPAVLPIVFNPLPDSSPFAPYDRQLMDYWNLYQPDLFRAADPTGTWGFPNGVFDMAGFADDARLQAVLGRTWPDRGYAMVVSRAVDGHTVEADIVQNPAYPWTLDEAEATRPPFPLSFRHVVLSDLARAWGFHETLDLESLRQESAAGVVPQAYRLATIFSADTEALRATYGDAPVRDGLISAYGVQAAPVYPAFLPSRPIPSAVRRGGKFVLATPIKIENTGTEPLVNPDVEVFLVPRRFSLEGAIFLKRSRLRTTIERAALNHVVLGTVKVPRTAPPGVYYLAFRLKLAGDEYAGNDVAWSPYHVTLTVTAR